MKLDAEKLKKMIRRFVDETRGMCEETSATIGVIDGRKILITVTQDSDGDRTSLVGKWKCITGK